MAPRDVQSIGEEHGKRSRDSLHFFLWPIITAIAAAVLLELDPLGIEEGTAEVAHAEVMKLSATLYPIFHPLTDERADPVTVVLIDDDYLTRVGGMWPLNYRTQGYLLDLIAGYQPAAIFVNVVYDGRHAEPSDDPANLLGAIHLEYKTPTSLPRFRM